MVRASRRRELRGPGGLVAYGRGWCRSPGRTGRVFSRAQLLDSVWGLSADIDERTVDVHVGRLRKALSASGERDPIRTIRGAGYSFDETFAA